MSTWSRVRRSCAALLVVGLSVAGTTTAATARPAATEVSAPGLYIVALAAPPDLERPGRSARLRDAQDALLQQVGRPRVLYRFSAALNGFAAELTRDQVKNLRANPSVALVERSTLQRPDSVDSTPFIGAEEAWKAAGGPDRAGQGMVVGVVDTGIWPENPSFAALPGTKRRPAGFRGGCAGGEQWDEADCNSKVISARYFVKGFGAGNLAAAEYLSPRDGSGHGSRVAAVAAGNDRVHVRVDGQDFGLVSGMAPGARIAAYKACWTAPDPSRDGCTTADTVAALDRAVADGVDVISYAVSGPSGVDSDAVELAFLNATAAGVFVATSAGNRGPGRATVAHASPWVTTVAASTHLALQGAVVLGDRTSYVGAMVSDEAVPRTGLVLGEDVAAAGRSRADARLCLAGALDAAKVEGRIVVCDRGRNAREDKSSAVARAGGVGMVLANVGPDAEYSDFHAVPTVHLDQASARAVKRYVARSARPTAVLDPTASADTRAPRMAPFSSRGPVPRDGGSVLKPDLTAPGVSVFSATAPASSGGRRWDQFSGTSMSTAHVAGLAAVVMREHPRWTPAMVKSAMSTTAQPLPGVSGPLAAGAGQVDASAALDPGLVLDAPTARFRAWLAGRTPTRNLNLPSVAVGDLTGTTRVVRRVTNVSRRSETYTARVLGLGGLDVRVRPRTLRLAPGETGRFAVLLRSGTAPLEVPARGRLVWNGSTHQVRMPVVVTPRTVRAPEEATASGRRGEMTFQAVSGTSGRLDLAATGLTPAEPVGLTLEPGTFDPRRPDADADTQRFPVRVPKDAEALRVSLEGRDGDDLDLHLYRGGQLVAAANGSSSQETLTVVDPAPGTYEVYVSSAVAANHSTTTAQLYTWVLRPHSGRRLSAPRSVPVSAGAPFHVDLRWTGTDPTSRWLGQLRYGDSDQRTFVTLN